MVFVNSIAFLVHKNVDRLLKIFNKLFKDMAEMLIKILGIAFY